MCEKRRQPRIESDIDAIIRYKGCLHPVVITNISGGGICAHIDDPNIASDDNIEIIFDLDNNLKDLSIRGKVAHVEPSEDGAKIGIQFTGVFSDSFEAIQKYLCAEAVC